MHDLQKLIHSLVCMNDADDGPQVPSNVDLLLYSPCPVKLVVKDHLDQIVRAYQERGEPVTVHIPMGCTSIDPYDPIYKETDVEKLPSIIASIGFGDFWKKEFVNRFVHTGTFEAVLPSRINPLFERAGMIDPEGCYTIYGATPYIFLVDTRRLGSLPIPRLWEDLLDPRYRNEIVMCGDGDDMADAVVLNVFKEHGIEGLRQLAGNVKTIMHSSTMAKIAGSNDPDAAAVFIIPCFFAESTKQPAHVRVVWPEDGAAASPLYFLAKKSDRERLAGLISFFTEGFATIESASWFMPIGRTDLSNFPPHAALKWIGWKFIEENDVNTMRDQLNMTFRAMLRGLR
jgi:ABC-type Fe3+ transport system substrate-binding protein